MRKTRKSLFLILNRDAGCEDKLFEVVVASSKNQAEEFAKSRRWDRFHNSIGCDIGLEIYNIGTASSVFHIGDVILENWQECWIEGEDSEKNLISLLEDRYDSSNKVEDEDSMPGQMSFSDL